MKLYLVTGGCGFIGSHLCAALLRQGHAVRVLDDLSTGRLDNLPAGVELRVGSVTDAAAVRSAVAGVDGCFHLAAIASVERGVRDWLETHRVNLGGTVTLLEAIAQSDGMGRVPFVYASSAAVYGNCEDLPITEQAQLRPLSAYGVDKLGSEMHAGVATSTHGIPTTGLRFFNVYGPRQDPFSPYSGVLSIFARRQLDGQAIGLHGDGGQTRDFVYVGDVVAALMAAMARPLPGAPVFNVCTGRGTSILHLAKLVADCCDAPLASLRLGTRPGDIRHSVGSPSAFNMAYGFTPCTPLGDGLVAVLDWLRESRPPGTTPERGLRDKRVSDLELRENQVYEPVDGEPEQRGH